MNKIIICLFLTILLLGISNIDAIYIINELAESNSISIEKSSFDNEIKILFIGSSYFNYNNLPDLFKNLAIDSGNEVYIDQRCINGWYLDDHADDSQTEQKINEHEWDYVILQGAGPNIAYPDYFTDHPVYPALITLRNIIYENCESTKMVFCMPWAFEDGMTWYQDWTDTFEDMQILIYENTIQYANEIGFQIAPVGWAWYAVLEDQDYPLHYLHMSDWNHPSLRGSYLMGCVIFSTIFLESSLGISYTAGLPSDEVYNFQSIASDIVLNNLDLWNIENTDIEWYKTYGGIDNDWGWSVQNTIDGGFIIGGETASYGSGNFDAYLIKTDNYGNVEWDRTFGGAAKDGCRDLAQTTDGGFILTGYADSYGNPGHDYWIIKTDEFGNEEWSKIFGGTSSDASYAIIETSNGDFVFTGYSYSYSQGSNDVWVIKTDNLGGMIWEKNYGGIGSEYGMDLVETYDGGYIIIGSTTSYGSGGTDVYLLKIDFNGDLEWEKTFGGFGDDWAGSIDLTSDGGFIICGDTKSYSEGGYDVWILKTDHSGIEEWNCTYGSSEHDETGYCVRNTMGNGYIISGTAFVGGHDNGLVIKMDMNGNIEWNISLITDESDILYSICETQYGQYASAGYTYTYGAGNMDIWLIKIERNENQPPIADFSYIPHNPIENETVQFIDESRDPDGYIINWTWNINDDIVKYGEQVTHSFAYTGTYHINLTVLDNDQSIGVKRKTIYVDEEGIIDVNQSMYDRGFPIRHAVDGDWGAAQCFIQSLDLLSYCKLYLRKFGTPEFNLTVEIRENNPQGLIHEIIHFLPGDISSNWQWLTINFENIVVTPDTEYFIVCPPAPSDVTTSFGYEWGYAFGDIYPEGSFWFTRDGGGLWRDLDEVYEFTFRTYGYS